MSKIYYVGLGPEEGTVVSEKDAYEYVMYRCLKCTPEEHEEFRKAVIDWYYSGNWKKEVVEDV